MVVNSITKITKIAPPLAVPSSIFNANNNASRMASQRWILIVTTWRSGSTFTAELISSLPGTNLHYEPLMEFGFQDLLTQPADHRTKAEKMIANLFSCRKLCGSTFSTRTNEAGIFVSNWLVEVIADSSVTVPFFSRSSANSFQFK